MDRDGAMRWVEEYERTWRTQDVAAVARLFTDDARYLRSPFAEPLVGLDAIGRFWLVDDGASFAMRAEVVAVDGADAVVRVEVEYLEPEQQEYRDLWVLRFAPDGRVEHFEEWAYWPEKPYTVAG
ncbi:AtzH-like domain-containing protein [Cellulosimicrobium arenosum]|uniref:Nuclear transport factor 2 family protein n=1 Tax=Cellulosimicrobium arenosum TaxID=2708133 RepID=A0A927J069_9MICO|nr:nuclear transport factor 2 family protein [Cellulosimicrobium arenosum]MBD8079435.1 nuclear transport factor 2 family protein [Cellulosimicrobium arenosum]